MHVYIHTHMYTCTQTYRYVSLYIKSEIKIKLLINKFRGKQINNKWTDI